MKWTQAIEEMATAIAESAPTEEQFRELWGHLGTVVRYLSVTAPVVRQRIEYGHALVGLLDRTPEERWPSLMDRIERVMAELAIEVGP